MTDAADVDGSPSVTSGRPAFVVAAGILLSRLSGLLREVVLAAALGAATLGAEAFEFALRVPKILQNLLGEGALSASFIPVYAQRVDDDPAAARKLAGAVFGLLAALVAGIVLVLMLAARPIVRLFVRGASPERVDLMADLLLVMAPGVGFIVFAAWCLGVLNANRDFFLSYVAPVVWNAAIVVAVIIGTTATDNLADVARAAAWGVFIGGVLQFAVQLPRVLRLAGPITPSLDRSLPDVSEVFRRFVPGVAGRGVVTLSTFVDLFLAFFLAVGGLVALAKAQVLYALPISVFAISIAAADLPELARDDAGDQTVRLRTSIDRVVLFLSFSMILFVLGGRSVVGAVFERGRFDDNDTAVVWATLAVMSVGLLGTGLSRLLQNARFAVGDVAGPARIAAVRLVVAAALGAALMFPADRFGVVDGLIERIDDLAFSPLPADVRESARHRLGAVGLAAGGAVAAWVEFGLLRRRSGDLRRSLGIGASTLLLIPACIASGLVIAAMAWLTNDLHPLVAAPLVAGPGAIVHLGVAAATGSTTARALVTRPFARF